jgi:hypothetical protein
VLWAERPSLVVEDNGQTTIVDPTGALDGSVSLATVGVFDDVAASLIDGDLNVIDSALTQSGSPSGSGHKVADGGQHIESTREGTCL